MDIRINGHEIELPGDDATSVGDVLATIRGSEEQNGRVLTHIELDQQVFTLQDPAVDLTRPASEFSCLVVASDKPRDMSARILRETAGHMPRLQALIAEAAEAVRGGRMPEGAQMLEESLSYWGTIQEVVQKTAILVEADLDALTFEGRSAAAHLADVAEQLNQLKDALQQRDMVLVADLLEYEFTPLVERWSGVLSFLADHMEQAT